MNINLGVSKECSVSPTFVTFMKTKFLRSERENSVLKLDGNHARNTSFCRRPARYADIGGRFTNILFFFSVLMTNLTRMFLQQRLRPWVGMKSTIHSSCKLDF